MGEAGVERLHAGAGQRGEWLVEQHDVRGVEEGHREPQPLALAHGQAVRAVRQKLADPEPLDRLAHGGIDLVPRHEREPRPELGVLGGSDPAGR